MLDMPFFFILGCVMEHKEVLSMKWATSTRYYTVALHQDLLEDWVLTIAFGGRSNRLGSLKHRAVVSKEAGLVELEAIAKTRKKRGYFLVRSVGL